MAETPEFDPVGIDLKLPELGSVIESKRALVLDSGRDVETQFPSLNEVVRRHTRKLGITPDQFQSAAKAQNLDLDYLVGEIGRKGRFTEDVVAELKAQRAPAVLEPETRKVQVRGEQIAQQGLSRAIRGEGREVEATGIIPEELVRKVAKAGTALRVYSPDEDLGGEAAVVQPGQKEFESVMHTTRDLLDDSTEDGRMRAELVEKWGRNIILESGMEKYVDPMAAYYTEKQAGRLGIDEFDPQYDQIYQQSRRRAFREVALMKTTGKWISPSLISWEKIFPDQRVSKSDDPWLEKAWDRASRVRVELVGVDARGEPVFKLTNPTWHIFEMSDAVQSAVAGGLIELGEDDQRDIMDKFSEGALEGIERRQLFIDAALSTDIARESSLAAFGLGTAGLAATLLTPDLMFGVGGAAKVTKRVAAALKNVKHFKDVARQTVPLMADAAKGRTAAESILGEAEEALRRGDLDAAKTHLEEAAAVSRQAEVAEAGARKSGPGVMDQVDSTDSLIYHRQAELIPEITPQGSRPIHEALGGSFGYREEGIHPAARRRKFRLQQEGASVIPYPEYYDSSRIIDNLIHIIDDVQAGRFRHTKDVLGKAVAPVRKSVHKLLKKQKLNRTALTEHPDKLKAWLNLHDYLDDTRNVPKLLNDPSGWIDDVVSRFKAVTKGLDEKTVSKMADDLSDVLETTTKVAGNIQVREIDRPDRLRNMLASAVSSVRANTETRVAALVFVRERVADRALMKADPLILKAASKFEEFRELSSIARRYRKQIKKAFKFNDKQATLAARILDLRANSWARQTGRPAEDWFTETFPKEAFKDKEALFAKLFGGPPEDPPDIEIPAELLREVKLAKTAVKKAENKLAKLQAEAKKAAETPATRRVVAAQKELDEAVEAKRVADEAFAAATTARNEASGVVKAARTELTRVRRGVEEVVEAAPTTPATPDTLDAARAAVRDAVDARDVAEKALRSARGKAGRAGAKVDRKANALEAAEKASPKRKKVDSPKLLKARERVATAKTRLKAAEDAVEAFIDDATRAFEEGPLRRAIDFAGTVVHDPQAFLRTLHQAAKKHVMLLPDKESADRLRAIVKGAIKHAKKVIDEAEEGQTLSLMDLTTKSFRDRLIWDTRNQRTANRAFAELMDSLAQRGVMDSIATRPEHIRAAARSSDILLQAIDGKDPLFYSRLEQIVETMPKKMAVGDVVRFLAGKGAKAEEIKWTNVQEFLDDAAAQGKKSVTRDEVLAHLTNNRVVIEETISNQVPENVQRLHDSMDQLRSGVISALARTDTAPADRHAFLANPEDWLEARKEDVAHELRYLHESWVEDEPVMAEAIRPFLEEIDLYGHLRAGSRLTGEDYTKLAEILEPFVLASHRAGQLSEWQAIEAVRRPARDISSVSRILEAESGRAWLRAREELREAEEAASIRSVHHEDLTLPGGDDYREILIQLLPKPVDPIAAGYRIEETAPGNWRSTAPDGTVLDSFLLNQREGILAAQRDLRKKINFTHDHWPGEENVVVHFRVKIRQTADGRRVFFVEEIQSDWHQVGRAQGYLDESVDEATASFDEAMRAFDAERTRMWEWRQANPRTDEINRGNRIQLDLYDYPVDQWKGLFDEMSEVDRHAFRAYRQWHDALSKADPVDEYGRTALSRLQRNVINAADQHGLQIRAASETAKDGSVARGFSWAHSSRVQPDDVFTRAVHERVIRGRVPDGPFKDTKAWAGLAVKRIMRMAADEGFDDVVFTSGIGAHRAAQMPLESAREFYDKILPSVIKKHTKAPIKKIRTQDLFPEQSFATHGMLGKSFNVVEITPDVKKRVGTSQTLFQRTDTRSPEFKQWSGGAPVIKIDTTPDPTAMKGYRGSDIPDGPVVIEAFHGTPKFGPIKAFKIPTEGEIDAPMRSGMPGTQSLGPAIYHSPDYDIAKGYSERTFLDMEAKPTRLVAGEFGRPQRPWRVPPYGIETSFQQPEEFGFVYQSHVKLNSPLNLGKTAAAAPEDAKNLRNILIEAKERDLALARKMDAEKPPVTDTGWVTTIERHYDEMIRQLDELVDPPAHLKNEIARLEDYTKAIRRDLDDPNSYYSSRPKEAADILAATLSDLTELRSRGVDALYDLKYREKDATLGSIFGDDGLIGTPSDISDIFRRYGYDSVISDPRVNLPEVVVFNPEQVRPAIKGRAPQPGDPKILFQRADAAPAAAKQTGWEMKELGEGLVEITSKEIRAARQAGEAPVAEKLPEPTQLPGEDWRTFRRRVREEERVFKEKARSAEAQRQWDELGTESTVFKEWSGGAPVVEKGGPIPDGPAIVRVFRGAPRGWDNVAKKTTDRPPPGWPYEAREGYAVFASAEPRTAMTYGHEAGVIGFVAPMFAKVDRVIEFDKGAAYGGYYAGTHNFSKVDFDARAKRLRPGEALVVRGVADYKNWESLAPVGLKQGDPRLLNDDIWAFGAGTEFKPQNFLAETQPLLKSTDPQLLKTPSRAPEAPAEVMGGGLTFKVEGDVLRVQTVELPEALRGQGIGQELYLRAMEHAKSIGKGFESDIAPSPDAIATYERLIEAGIPLTRKTVEAADGKMVQQFVATADDLADASLDVAPRGGRVVETATDTPAFKSWFGGSKVVDDAGEPLVVYHGTTGDFDAFKPAFFGDTTRAWGEPGFFFSSRPEVASSFASDFAGRETKQARRIRDAAKARAERTKSASDIDEFKAADARWRELNEAEGLTRVASGANVVPAYVRLENPYIFDAKGRGLEAIDHDVFGAARQAGNDGIIYKNVNEGVGKEIVGDVYIPFAPTQIKSKFNRGTFDPTDPRILFQDVPEGIKGAVDFLEDGRSVVYALDAADFSTFIHEIGHVMRRDLDDKAMSAVTDWIKSKGVEVTHKGGQFIGDKKAVEDAEELFARGFEKYVLEGKPPLPGLKGIFEQMKQWMTDIYRGVKQSEEVGEVVDLDISPELRKVFDALLEESAPRRPLLPRTLELMRRELAGPAQEGIKVNALAEIVRELRKTGGHKISEEDIWKQVREVEAGTREAVELPGPVFLAAGLKGHRYKGGKTKFSIQELSDLQAEMTTSAALLQQAGTKVPLASRRDAIQELKPSEMVDNWVGSDKGVQAWARSVFLGGDPIADMRTLKPEVRSRILAGTRLVEQAIGDAVKLIEEGKFDQLAVLLSGGVVRHEATGREALSSGHDMIGSAAVMLRRQLSEVDNAKFYADTGLDVDGRAFDVLTRFFENINNPAVKLSFTDLIQDPDYRAVSQIIGALLKSSRKSFLGDIFKAAGIKESLPLANPQEDLKVVEALLYNLNMIRRFDATSGKMRLLTETLPASEDVTHSASMVAHLYADLRGLFKKTPQRGVLLANRTMTLIAGHGMAEKARLRWVELGIAVDADTMTAFHRWINGEAIESASMTARVEQLYQVAGYSPRFQEMVMLDGISWYIPKAARKRLDQAIARAVDPDVTGKLSGDLLEQIGGGQVGAGTSTQRAFAVAYRYLKTRMVRGHFVLKSRYFWMNTYDHFNQLSLVAGFRPAFVSTMRLIPQNALANPVAQYTLAAMQKAGVEGAPEAARRALTKLGDRGANFAGWLLRTGKWNVNLNAVMDARDGAINIGGRIYTNASLRQIMVEEAIFSSFDTSQLGVKIRKSADMWLADAKEQNPSFGQRLESVFTDNAITRISEDIAEGWAERERAGAAITLMEMGLDPRTACRVTVNALYDYAGSMSKWDRMWLINIFFPFWAFQKNANRQMFDTLFSPAGAYRLGVMRRAYHEGSEILSTLLYQDTVDEFGLDYNNMDSDTREIYDMMRFMLVEEYGMMDKVPPAVVQDIRNWIAGVHADRVLADGRLRAMPELQEFLLKTGRLRLSEYYIAKPDTKFERPYRQGRPGLRVPFPLQQSTKRYVDLLRQEDMDAPFTTIFLPEPMWESAFSHMGYQIAAMVLMMDQAVSMTGYKLISDEDDGREAVSFLDPLLEVWNPSRAMLIPQIAELVGWETGAYPTALHPFVGQLADQHGLDVLVLDATDDALTRARMIADAEAEGEEPPIDPQREEGTIRDPRYYLMPGAIQLLYSHTPLMEFNRLALQLEQSPIEERAGVRGDLILLARALMGLETETVFADKAITFTRFSASREEGTKDVEKALKKGRKTLKREYQK